MAVMVGGRCGSFFVKWNCPGLATGEIGREEREAKCWMTLLSCFCRHKYEFGRGKDLFVAFGAWGMMIGRVRESDGGGCGDEDEDVEVEGMVGKEEDWDWFEASWSKREP